MVDATILLGPPDMAKKRTDPEIPKTLFSIKGVESWHNWIREFADHQGVAVMSLIDEALREHARNVGFPRPMPKRTK